MLFVLKVWNTIIPSALLRRRQRVFHSSPLGVAGGGWLFFGILAFVEIALVTKAATDWFPLPGWSLTGQWGKTVIGSGVLLSHGSVSQLTDFFFFRPGPPLPPSTRLHNWHFWDIFADSIFGHPVQPRPQVGPLP